MSLERHYRWQAPALGTLRHEGYMMPSGDVELNVQIDEAPESASPITIVYSHGYAVTSDTFHYQRAAFRREYRQVMFDQRGHGPSTMGEPTMDALAADLGRVIDETCPDSPVALVGHSMGAMSIAALPRVRPDLLARVQAVALLTTSVRPFRTIYRVAPTIGDRVDHFAGSLARAVSSHPTLHAGLGTALPAVRRLITRHVSFATNISDEHADALAGDIHSVPPEVLADFLPMLGQLDESASLRQWEHHPAFVVGAGRDRITPVREADFVASTLPNSRYLRIPVCGHHVEFEYPALLEREIRELLRRAEQRLGVA